jgi:uncharacterized protein (TIGR02145 family)
MRKIVLLLGLVVLTACSTSDYEFINIQQTIRDVQDCSLNKTNQSKSCSQMASIEYDSFGRIRYTEMLGNSISIYWHPYNLSPAEILAIRIQNNESDEWYNASGEELGVFKSVFAQTYGNTFSNNVLNFFIGLIYDETPTPVIEGANLNTENENVENKESEEKYPNTDIIQGVFTDKRDGKQYKYTVIGTQTWMAENLNYSDSINYPSMLERNWCYNNNLDNCAKFGRLYTWSAAMDSVGTFSSNGKGCGNGDTCSPTFPVRGICPEGWHLPTKTEFETLVTTVGGRFTAGKMLKSTSGWDYCNGMGNGTDAFGFNVLPAGLRNSKGDFIFAGESAYFWSATEDDESYAYGLYLDYTSEDAGLDSYDKGNASSVRCLRD